MKRHRYLWLFVGLLVLVSLACNAFAGQPLAPTLPRPGLPGEETGGDGDLSGLPTAVIQHIAPTVTLPGNMPTTPPTAVIEPVAGSATLRALVDVNIRLGPGVQYTRDSFLLKGETAVVLGRHAQSGWWKIVCPERVEGNTCWVSGGPEYTSVSNMENVSSLDAPPTPTAAPTPEPTSKATAVSDANTSATSSEAAATDTSASEEALTNSLPLANAKMVYADKGALWLLPLAETSTAEPTWLVDAEEVGNVLISPNGRYVAYITQQDVSAALHIVDMQSGQNETLVDAADLAEMSPADDLAALIGQLQWLADSKTLAFNTTIIDRAGGPGLSSQEDLWTVTLDGVLTERFPAGEGGGSFAISADNVALLGQKTAVLRANLDGSQAETVIRFPAVNTASEFAFYPWLQWLDGGAFAQAALSSPEPYTKPEANLWRIPATGKAESLITLPGNIIFSPVIWSDSGEQAGYIRQLTGRESALVIGAGDGQNMTPYGDAADLFFGWNPAGKQFVYTGPGTYAIGQAGEEPLLIDMAEGKTAVAAQWLNDKTFIIALGSADNWDFRWQTVAGPATRLISGSTTALFDIWSPPKTRG